MNYTIRNFAVILSAELMSIKLIRKEFNQRDGSLKENYIIMSKLYRLLVDFK